MAEIALVAAGLLDNIQQEFLRNPAEYESIPILSFRSTQAIRILALQGRLETLAHNMRTPPPDEEWTPLDREFDGLLHTYANAIRDYETLSQEDIPLRVFAPSRSSMLCSRIFAPQRYSQMKKRMAWLHSEQGERFNRAQWAELRPNLRELNREVRIEMEKKEAYWERLWMGIFGGLALVGPMLVMALRRDLNTSLITTSIATTLFVIFLAIMGQNLGGKDVLAATAAYAAVLVVFVGTSISES